MSDFDYSIYYGRFHPDSEAHARVVSEQIASQLASCLPEDRSIAVLDVGCGYGFALNALKILGFKNVEGVELSAQQAERARNSGFRVHVVEDTAIWLAGRVGSYAVVLLRDVLEHLPTSQQIPLLRSIHASLQPGGRLIVQVPNANAILAARWRYNDFTHYSSFTEHSLYFVLRNAGFEDIQISSEKGLGLRPSLRVWRRESRTRLRKYLIRWCWLQVYKAELPSDSVEDISFELNLNATAFRRE